MTVTDFTRLNTVEALCAVYDGWLADKGYEPQSADELHYDLLGQDPRPENDLLWLAGFINQWDIVMDLKNDLNRKRTDGNDLYLGRRELGPQPDL
ncbi:MAG: hypothetical protein ACK5XN_21050 [Bacteroidota bacterium]